jgi:hypothetical protein
MATTKAKPKKAKRRLKNLVIDEISLVDNPAVPEAEFLIAKRDELSEFDQVIKETAERIAKGGSGTYALQDVLRMTADVIGMIRGLSAIAASGDLDDKVVKSVLAMLKQYGVTIAVNNADGVPIDMMAAAVYDNTKSESEVIADDGIEKAQRVLSNQQFKDLSKACDMLKGVVDRARKIGKADEDDEAILQVGEAGEAARDNDATATEPAPASATAEAQDRDADAADESEPTEDVVESVEDASDSTETEQSDEVVEDTIAAATGEDATSGDDGEETESVAEKVAKLWAQRQQEKAQQKKRADDARLNAAASRLGDSLSQLSSRLDRIADRVGSATGGGK